MAKQKPNSKQLIPLSEIAPQTPYSAEYLRLRILQGKLKGEKVGRNWYTQKTWINEYLKQYSSAENIPQESPETPVVSAPVSEQNMRTVPLDHLLALIAYPRAELIEALETGLLNGLKVGEEWYTRRDWLSSYIAEYGVKPEVAGVRAFAPRPISVIQAPVIAPKPLTAPVAQPTVIQQPMAAPAPQPVIVHEPVIASEPEPIAEIPISNFQSPVKFQFPISRIIQKFRLLGNWLLPACRRGREIYWNLKIGTWKFLKAIPLILSSKSFQRAAAGALVALVLFLSVSSPQVRASFMDWSQAAAVAITNASQRVKTVVARDASVLALNAKIASTAAARQISNVKSNLNAKIQNLVLGIKSFDLDLNFDSLAFDINIPSLPDIKVPDINLPDFNLPSFSLPRLALPDINLPSFSLPSLPAPDFSFFTKKLASISSFFETSVNRLALLSDSLLLKFQTSKLPNYQTTTHGLVLGESIEYSDLPVSSQPGLLSQSLSSFSQSFKSTFDLLNPSSPTSLMARLSGQVSEIGSAIGGQADPLTKASSFVTSFFSQINLGKILQPAGSFIARLSPRHPEQAAEGGAVKDLSAEPRDSSASPRNDTTVSGELSLQPAASLTPEPAPELAANLNLPKNTPASPTAPAPIRYTTPVAAPKSLQTLTQPSPLKGEGTLSVSVPATASSLSSYFILTDPNTLQTAKAIHTLSNLIADQVMSAKDLKVATISSTDIAAPLTIASPTIIQDSLSVNKDLNVIGALTTPILNAASITSTSITTNHLSTNSISATGSLSGKSFSGQFGSFTNLSSNSASFGGNNNDTFLSKSPSTFESTLTVQGAASLASTLSVAGAATLTGNTAIGGTLSVTGATTLSGALTVPSLTVTGATAFQGSQTIADTLSIATSTVSSPQFKTGYDAANYLSFSTDASGTTTLNAIGGQYASLIISDPLRIATSSGNAFEIQSGSGASLLTANTLTNRLGIGTASPSSALHVQNTASPQFTLAYDDSNYYTTAISSTGACDG